MTTRVFTNCTNAGPVSVYVEDGKVVRVRPLAAYGPWRRSYPHIGCGLKRGFTYFRQISSVLVPAAASFRIETTCSSLYRFFGIFRFLQV